MRLDSAREASATFLLGMLLAGAVITVGQIGPLLGLPLTPPWVWDAYEALTVPFERAEPITAVRREDPPPEPEIVEATPTTVSDRGPALGTASRAWADPADAPTKAGSDRSSKGRDVSRRDEPATPRPDRGSTGAPTDDGGAGGKGLGNRTQGAVRRAAHGPRDRVVTPRPHKALAAAAHRDGTSVTDKRGPARAKHKARATKARSKQAHILRGRPT